MKRISFIIAFASFVNIAYAQTFKYDGISYQVIDNLSKSCRTIEADESSYYKDELIIPSFVLNGDNDYTVVEIGSYSFGGHEEISSVVLPETVTSIGESAFEGCLNLKKINFPDLLSSIGSSAFVECTSLYSIEIPESIETIGNWAFYKCDNIKDIYYKSKHPIHADKNIFSSDIYNFARLHLLNIFPEDIILESPWMYFSIIDDIFEYNFENNGLQYRIIDRDLKTCGIIGGSTGLFSMDELVIPSSVSNDRDDYTVIEVGDESFKGYNRLTSIGFPETITSIGESAFAGCSNLRTIDLPQSLTTIGEYAFQGCIGLTTIAFPQSLTSIGNHSFQGCTGVTSMNLPQSLTTIGEYAFQGCTGLTTIAFPQSLTSIGNNSFQGCTGVTSLDLPQSLTTIGEYAFQGCTGLTTIAFPQSITSIGNNSFQGCTRVTSLDLPQSLTMIGDYAFQGCTGLTTIAFSQSITSIGNHSFQGCTGVTSLDLPQTLTTIGEYAFQGCTGLTTIAFPQSLTSIGNHSFQGCTGVTSLDLPQSLTTIGEYAFQGCTGLTSIDFPLSLTSIGNGAYTNCSQIRNITNIGSNPIPGSADLFMDEVYKKAILNMPNTRIDDIMSTTPWSKFWHINAKDEKLTVPETGVDFEVEGITYSVKNETDRTLLIKNGKIIAASGNSSERKLEIPMSINAFWREYKIVEIGDYSFRDNIGLTSVTIPSSVSKIGKSPFSGCDNLTSIIYHGSGKLQDDVVTSINNPNLLLYVEGKQSAPESLDQNIIITKTASGIPECERLVLTPGYPFRPAMDFISHSSRMTKTFTQETPLDGCGGWETIVLPFDVTKVYVDDVRGELTPFAMINDIYTQYPFWLCEVNRNGGWKHALSIKSGMPYVISMPNNPAYEPRYNIEGPVTFANESSVTISASTASPYAATWTSGREFRSVWLPLDETEADMAMGLNANITGLTDDEGKLLEPGSAFHTGVLPRPLEAYVTRLGNSRALRISESQSSVLMTSADGAPKVRVEDGVLVISSDSGRRIDVFRIDGTLYASVDVKAGETVTVSDLPMGMYIVERQKIIIR